MTLRADTSGPTQVKGWGSHISRDTEDLKTHLRCQFLVRDEKLLGLTMKHCVRKYTSDEPASFRLTSCELLREDCNQSSFLMSHQRRESVAGRTLGTETHLSERAMEVCLKRRRVSRGSYVEPFEDLLQTEGYKKLGVR